MCPMRSKSFANKQLRSRLFVKRCISVGWNNLWETESLPVICNHSLQLSQLKRRAVFWLETYFWREELIWLEPKRKWKSTFLPSPFIFLMSSTLFLKLRPSPWEGCCRPCEICNFAFSFPKLSVLFCFWEHRSFNELGFPESSPPETLSTVLDSSVGIGQCSGGWSTWLNKLFSLQSFNGAPIN